MARRRRAVARRASVDDRRRRGSCSAPTMHLQAPPNLRPTTCRACSTPASTTGAASRRSRPTTSTPSAVAGARAAARARPRRAGKMLVAAARRLPRATSRDAERWLDAGVAHRGAARMPTREGLARDDDWAPGADRAADRAAARRCGAVGPPVARDRSTASRAGERRSSEDEIVAPVRGARRRASRACRAAADELRREVSGDAVTLRRQPQHQLHERLLLQVPLLRVLEGPARREPARARRTSRRSTRSRAARARPGSAAPPRSACRAASIPTSTATTTSTSAAR